MCAFWNSHICWANLVIEQIKSGPIWVPCLAKPDQKKWKRWVYSNMLGGSLELAWNSVCTCPNLETFSCRYSSKKHQKISRQLQKKGCNVSQQCLIWRFWVWLLSTNGGNQTQLSQPWWDIFEAWYLFRRTYISTQGRPGLPLVSYQANSKNSIFRQKRDNRRYITRVL